jgi:hypothetical protein
MARLRRRRPKRNEKAQGNAAKKGTSLVTHTEAVRIMDELGQNDEPLPPTAALAQSVQAVATEGKDNSVASLVARLEAIRERIWRLQSVFAVSLSHDVALEANKFLVLFQSLAQQLKAKDAAALDRLVRGHESLLLSPPVLVKQTIPLVTQRWCEIKWEAQKAPHCRVEKRSADAVPDGLGWML